MGVSVLRLSGATDGEAAWQRSRAARSKNFFSRESARMNANNKIRFADRLFGCGLSELRGTTMKHTLGFVLLCGLWLGACAPPPTPIPPTLIPAPTAVPSATPAPLPTVVPSVTPAPLPTVVPSVTPAPLPTVARGTLDPDFVLDVYDPAATWGTTIFADNHNLARPRIVEVNLLGEVVWQYLVPDHLRQFTNPGFDVEPLANGNLLFVLPRNGVYEIERSGKVVWAYLNSQVSHDADRLPNGNTLIAFGAQDRREDAQLKEVNPRGEIVWQWFARDYFNVPPYTDIFEDGWTHTNAVTRLPNGNTLISLRNFHFVAELDPRGAVVQTIGKGIFQYQHDPEMLPNGNLLLINHTDPNRVFEFDLRASKMVWQYPVPRQLVRDANRLPNGNTLITGSTTLFELSPQNKIVWQFGLKTPLERQDAAGRGFYKAERIGLVPGK